MAWYSIVSILVGSLGGLFGVASTAMFWRANRRIKNVEAGKAEISLENERYTTLQREIEFLRKEVSELSALYHNSQGELNAQRKEYGTLLRKYSYRKLAMNCALECPNAAANAGQCPVMKKQAEFDLKMANENG